jgi:prepilin-type N-terminal cleavage/methylation domain-containing protein
MQNLLLTRRARNDKGGFTLIELLIVVAIIAILASVAMPQFFYYKERAIRSSMVSDARNTATMLEAYFTDFGTYVSVAARNAVTGPGTYNWPDVNYRVKVSKGNTLTAVNVTDTTYEIEVAHISAGTDKSPLSLDSTGVCQYADSSGC